MDSPARNWRMPEVKALADHARQWIEGDPRAPVMFVQMTPEAVLILMAQNGMTSVDAIITVPEGTAWPDPLDVTRLMATDMGDAVALVPHDG